MRRTEQRQGLRQFEEMSHLCAESRRGRGDTGRFGTHLPELARRGGGGGRVVRPPSGPGPGADELVQVLELTRYFNARHEKLVTCHGAGLCPADLAMPTSRHYSRLPVPACGRAELATAAHGTADPSVPREIRQAAPPVDGRNTFSRLPRETGSAPFPGPVCAG